MSITMKSNNEPLISIAERKQRAQDAINELREKYGVQQKQIAEDANVGENSMSNLMSGNRYISLPALARIEKVLDAYRARIKRRE